MARAAYASTPASATRTSAPRNTTPPGSTSADSASAPPMAAARRVGLTLSNASPGYRHRGEGCSYRLRGRVALELGFRPKDKPVREHSWRHTDDVVGRHERAPGDSRCGSAGG